MCIEHSHDDSHNAKEHDDTLNEVVHRRSLIATEDDIDSRQDGHNHHTVFIRDAKTHFKERRDTFIDTCGIGNQEYKGDDGRSHTESLIGKTRTKEIGHRTRLDMLRHQFGTAPQQHPRQPGTYHSVAHADPGRAETVFPSELSGIAHKDHSREIRSTKSKSR